MSQNFDCKTRKMEEGMMGQSNGPVCIFVEFWVLFAGHGTMEGKS
jgi:hypothetical protein